jgi:hypothetical protein
MVTVQSPNDWSLRLFLGAFNSWPALKNPGTVRKASICIFQGLCSSAN